MTASYGLRFAPSNFRWSGERAPGLPIISEPNGTVSEPLLRFFGWSFRYKRVKISSMHDEAYVLRDFLAYLDERGVPWNAVDDQVLIEWRERLKEQEEASEHRISRRLAVVFTFYDHAKEACLLQHDLVGPKGPIKCRDKPSLASVFRMRPARRPKVAHREWACAESHGRNMTRRPIPDDTAVDAVLTYLRASNEDKPLGDRDWLIGRIMAEAGLRAAEAVNLTVDVLEAGLKAERIHVPKPEPMEVAREAGWNPRLKGLDAVARWEPGRRAVLAGLDRLERNGRMHIYVTVVGKGNVKRSAPFPIALMRDLVSIAIWEVRAEQLKCGRIHPGPRQVFLSNKTKGPLKARAVGNLIKAAFAAVEVEGSGHRLRAHFATNLAERLWAKAFADNLYRWDQTVENNVLLDLAQALGHAEPTTTVKHYLDLGRAQYFKVGDKSHLKAVRKVVNALADNHRQITPTFAAILAELIDVRGKDGPEGAALEGVLKDILNLHANTAPEEANPENGVPPLKSVIKRGHSRLRLVPKAKEQT